MKHVLVTGADGYIGRGLCARLQRQLAAREIDSLTLLDVHFDDGTGTQDVVRRIEGDLADAAVLARATDPAPDLVFHLAGITSRQAEEDFELGLRVNVLASIALLERLRALGHAPVLVYASSIGVYGTPLPETIDDDTQPAPTLSYGAQKRAMEIMLADYTRRGWLDARALRLPSVVARPAAADGALSAFASDLIREPVQGRRYACPIGPDGTLWLLSLPACVESLLHAARVAPDRLPQGRAWNLPSLRASAKEIVAALQRRFGAAVAERVEYKPVPELQAQFAQWPPLAAMLAQDLDFRHDGDLDTLVERALAT